MRVLAFALKAIMAIAIVAGLACAADFVMRKVAPENTRHARFGDSCRGIHYDLAEADGGKAPAAHCITVHFGTPRKPVGEFDEPDFGFGSDLDAELHWGYADISLPLLASEEKDGQSGVRKRGEVDLKPDGAPDTKDDTTKFASVTQITESGKTNFLYTLNSALADSDTNTLLVFVHGYNQSFDQALIRAAQISVDLTFNPEDPVNAGDGDEGNFGEPSYAFGRPVLFSWPNGSFLCAYCSDQTKAEQSAPFLNEFLKALMEETDAEEINIVVHSMGNRVLVEAIERLAEDHVRLKRVKTFRIVNAAADVERDAYAQAMANAEKAGFAPQVTIYASQNDLAMAASFVVNGFKARLGQILPAGRPFESADARFVTIDTDVVSADLFGHGYYSESGNVIADMSCFFADRKIGDERAIEPVAALSDGRRHYRFVAPGEKGLKVCAPGAPPLTVTSPEAYFSALGLSYEEYGRKRRDSISPTPLADSPSPMQPPEPSLPALVYFAYGDAELGYEAQFVIESEILAAGIGPDVTRIVVEGHTDAMEAQDPALAQLGLARAEAVKAFLVERGGVAPEIVEVRDMGASTPAAPTPAGAREPANRRAVITVERR